MVTAYYIATDTPHVEACWEWLKFVLDYIPQNGLSARRSLVASDEFRAYVGEEAQAALSQAQQKAEAYLDCLRQRPDPEDRETADACFQEVDAP